MNDKDYNEMVDTFGTPGWQSFIKQLEETLQSMTVSAPHSATTNDEWQYLRGWLACANAVVGHENFVRASYESELEDMVVYDSE